MNCGEITQISVNLRSALVEKHYSMFRVVINGFKNDADKNWNNIWYGFLG